MEGLSGFSASSPMAKGQCQVLQASPRFALGFGELVEQASDLDSGINTTRIYRPQVCDEANYSQLKVYTPRQLSHVEDRSQERRH